MGAEPARVKIFPLAGALLFPRSQLPLHIFEERYRDMVAHALDGDRKIAMVQPQGLDDDAPLHQVGGLGEIISVEELEDGRYNIVLQGLTRFRMIREAPSPEAYRLADVDLAEYDDAAEPDPLGIAQRSAVEQEARSFGDALGLAVDWEAVGKLDDETLVNAIAQVAPFDIGAKQALLETPTLGPRADMLVQLMQFQRMAPGGPEADQTLQ
ncbi:LON peptidase substrate-binding domain-containing protein [Sphingomicrobium sp. B8]|uniref:LON peptidase substrate-binding domain-containing protein n=2 Tax=Sphingomicrobium clamense TaxID=2851013 RepID=A0ABS6V340_9SPHN|nr:LON peptidase substrate-binding domain-containing protein [Sphingomicrobium sp. B8]MBW0143959.1 LON peptidase substrate-binding domain-containing protein [Sphingomicrobium sp. B8]